MAVVDRLDLGMVSGRWGEVPSKVTGQPASSSMRRTHLMQVAGGSARGVRRGGAYAPAGRSNPV